MSLQRQLEEAQRTNEILREEMRERVRSMQATIQTMSEELEMKDQELSETKAKLRDTEEEVLSLRAEILELEQMMTQTAKGLERSADQKSAEIHRLLQTVEGLNAELQQARQRLADSDEQLRLVDSVKRQALQDLAEKEDELAALRSRSSGAFTPDYGARREATPTGLASSSVERRAAAQPSPVALHFSSRRRDTAPYRPEPPGAAAGGGHHHTAAALNHSALNHSTSALNTSAGSAHARAARPPKPVAARQPTRAISPKRWSEDLSSDALLQTYPMQHHHPAFGGASTPKGRDRTPERPRLADAGAPRGPASVRKPRPSPAATSSAAIAASVYDLDGHRRTAAREEDDSVLRRGRRKSSLEYLRP